LFLDSVVGRSSEFQVAVAVGKSRVVLALSLEQDVPLYVLFTEVYVCLNK